VTDCGTDRIGYEKQGPNDRNGIMWIHFASLLKFLIVVVLVHVAYRFLSRRFRRHVAKTIEQTKGHKCICGYDMSGLDVARCPECGRVIGFDATPEQLGLTMEQLRRAQAKRLARERATSTDQANSIQSR
jgi:hypothetical protein